jgi:hypothetical protein
MPRIQYDEGDARSSTANTEAKLGVSDYFWRPWYAKLWWSCALIFGVLSIFATDIFSREWLQANDGWITLAGLALHPFTIVPVLGFPAVWAWRRTALLPWDPAYDVQSTAEEMEEELYGGENIGFNRRPLSHLTDPTDVRSPLNPISPAYYGRD